MKQRLRIDITHPALYPDVAELLRRIPTDLLYHQRHFFRHPAAIYQLSLRQLASDIMQVIRDCEAMRSAPQTGDSSEQLAHSQRILVYSLREHLDDCQMILMCLVDPAAAAAKGNGPDEFLKAAGFSERQLFWDRVHNYSDIYLMPIVNALKHSQGRFRTVRFDCSTSDLRIGFYLEEMDRTGVAQPAMKLHKGNSAFSYDRDIRFNLGAVFRAAEGLRSAIEASLKRLGRVPLILPEGADIGPGAWTDMCARVAAHSSGIFPQEVKMPFVRFALTDTGGLKIRELERDTQLSFPKGSVRCSTVTSGDGMTNSYRVPYALGNRPKI